MGIFEKSIPKYVVNPIDQTVEVAPQDVYVDDIFDPIFNANVRNAMRQKYGDGIYGVVGGYGDLLQNTWGGDKGIFGKGMGVLSTFGRSMEKADDIVLGLLTEGVEGLTGQGFDDPLKQIFVEDEDYTGKRLLAATANTFRGLAGGTTITEEDLGTAWNIPALGVELATDVGILGGGLARKFAPAAREFTSKELFKNLGKSDIKTTVGEVGQLMSNYDDLMSRVAIDITAPGLRPAFKKLRNRLLNLIPHHSAEAFVDTEMNGEAAPIIQMVDHISKTMDNIPKSEEEIIQEAAMKPSDIARTSVEDAQYNRLNYTLNRPETVSTDVYAKIDESFKEFESNLDSYERAKNKDVERFIKRLQEYRVPIEQIGIDRRQGLLTEDVSEIRKLIEDNFLKDYYNLYNQDVWTEYPEQLLKAWYGDAFDALANNRVRRDLAGNLEFSPSKSFQQFDDEAFYMDAFDTLSKETLKRDKDGNIIVNLNFSNTAPTLDSNIQNIFQTNPTYVSDLIDTISTDEGILEALETGRWSDNEALSSLVNAFLFDPKRADMLYYPKYNTHFTVSPSTLARLEMPGISKTISDAYDLMNSSKYVGNDFNVPKFESVEAFDAFMNSDNMTTALNAMFPPKAVDEYTKSKRLVDTPEMLDSDWQDIKIKSFKKKLKNVLYPEPGNLKSAYDNLKDLVDFFDTNADPDAWLGSAVPSEFEFLQKLYNDTDLLGTRFFDPFEGYSNTGTRELRRSRYFESLENSSRDLRDSSKVNVDDYVKTMLNTAARHIHDIDRLKKVYRSLMPYYQISLKQGNNVTSYVAKRTTDRFVNEVFPLAEEYTRKGGQIYSLKNNTYYPKYMKKEKVDSLKNLLGWGSSPDEDYESFRFLLNEVFTDSKYAPKKEQLQDAINLVTAEGNLELVNGKPTKNTVRAIRSKLKDLGNEFGFKPERDIGAALDGVSSNLSVDYDALPTHLLSKIQTPDNVLKALDTYPSLKISDFNATTASGRSQNFAVDEYVRIANSLKTKLLEAGFTSSSELQSLLDKLKTTPIGKLSPEEYRKLNTYASEYFKTIGQLPYYSVSRNVLDFKPDTGFNGLLQEISKVSDPKIRKRLKDLVSSEVMTHLSKQSIETFPAMQNDFEKLLNPSGELGDAAKITELERSFVSEFEKAMDQGDFSKIDRIRKKYYAKAKYLGHRTSFFKHFTDVLGWTARPVKSDFAYTPGNVSFVKDNLISKLPNKYQTAWRPSARNGLFYFDMHIGEKPDVIRIQENFDINPGNLQIWERSKMFSSDAIVHDAFYPNPKGYTTYLGYFDYSKLSPSGIEELSRKLSNQQLRMDRFSNYKTPAKYGTIEEALKSKAAPAEVLNTITNEAPETVAKQSTETISTASATAEDTVNKMAGEMNDFAKKGGSDSAGKTIFGERKWRWFKIIKDALSVSDKNSKRLERATLRTEIATALASRFQKLVARVETDGRFKDFKRFYILRQKQLGDVVSGKDFWTTFRRTGILVAPYEYGSKQASKTLKTLTKNAELINEAAGKPIVEVITKDIGSGDVIVMRFTGDLDTVKYVKKASKKLDTLAYSDVVFSPPKALTKSEIDFMDSSDMRELSGLMTELQNLSNEQAKLLGFNFDSNVPYTHHAMSRSDETANWLNDTFYDTLSSEDYDDLSKLISNFDEYRKTDRGAFGTMLQDRRFRGDYWLLDDGKRTIFEYSPNRIFTSTLADGMFANLQYQDFTDLFINDNFKIKGFFKTPEDLKKVLYAKTADGKLSGNFANSELVSFKLDENGRISGLIKYDKTTDAGLAKALADENTILVPANAISHMDNILKKDVRMNNKFWTFINKHFTIPFKFGLLSNPGFLLGNVSDSTLKLATTMSEKYGTTLTQELSNVTECMNASQVLKNDYVNAFDVWKSVSAEYGIKLSPEATIPEIVAMSPKYKEDFLKWLDGTLEVPFTYKNEAGIFVTEYRKVPCELSSEVVNNASIWTMLQGVQMNSNKMREYAELADIAPKSKFDVATNLFDRIAQGSGKYDKKNFRTWGLFMNNPYMKTLSDASGAWEDIIRTASILDDLRHGQYSKEDFAKFARDSASAEDTILKRVRLDEAKNTMFNAQFDYERQSDFISKIGKTVPFPIFFLKNFAYWMELFDKNPQFVDNAIDVQEGLWSGHNDKEDEFKTEAKGRGAIPVGGKALPDWFKGIYKPSPLQSMFGAFNLLNSPMDNLTYRVNPLVSGAKAAAAEVLPDSELTTLLQDPESVKYRPYSTDMYERNIRQDDPNFNPLHYTLHRMNPYDRVMNSYLRIPEKLEKDEFQLSDVLPSVFQPVF